MEKTKNKKEQNQNCHLSLPRKKGKYWLFHILSLKKNGKRKKGIHTLTQLREQVKMEKIVTLHIWIKQN